MSADRKNTVEQINDAFAENNLDKVLSFCTDDLVWTMVGDTTVKGKDAIRKWIASMSPQPPQLMIQQTVADGDVVITRGDMIMKDSKSGIAHTYSFCDVYRFEGDRVAELIAFVIRTDKTGAHEEPRKEAGRVV